MLRRDYSLKLFSIITITENQHLSVGKSFMKLGKYTNGKRKILLLNESAHTAHNWICFFNA